MATLIWKDDEHPTELGVLHLQIKPFEVTNNF